MIRDGPSGRPYVVMLIHDAIVDDPGIFSGLDDLIYEYLVCQVAVGTAFDPMSVVKDAVDDVDTKDSLYQRISANGTYDTNVPGTYTIQYFVTDSSGNTSDPQNFTLKVQ